jgi:hypothetical protein
MSDSELDTLVEYLFQYFGTAESTDPKSREVEKINVNKATAKEMETALATHGARSCRGSAPSRGEGPF